MKPLQLPVFPWDTLAPATKRCHSYPDGIVDLSVGSPVDTVPEVARQALVNTWDAHGYPTVVGSQSLREAIARWCGRQRHASCVTADDCFPTIGSKEMIANLCWQLGVEPGDIVLYPDIAYPTYDISARVAGATGIAVSMDDCQSWPTDATLVWLNTPSNPTGHVLDASHLRQIVTWARQHDAIVVSDECYAPITYREPWLSEPVPSILSDSVCQGDATGLLMVYSTSKQSNLAGYRASFIAGDSNLINRMIGVRKHCGYMAPTFTQAALEAVLGDEDHVRRQVDIYRGRRALLQPALEDAGLHIDDDCVAGLYLWACVDNKKTEKKYSGQQIVDKLSYLGILVAPGDFYGHSSSEYVRIALSETDENISSAVHRLREAGPLF